MPAMTVKAHDDGRTIQLDKPIKLVPNARRLVTVLEPADGIDTDWPDLAANALANAFSDEEPEYRPQAASHQ
ncbi:MAG: hypothetical protein K9L82_19100 [Chromatiaceae bacterium]|nr:hypothetical protein [Chromatiaceae bacterium]MCF7997229.1 hypothetical protein [Chromatiaceae bacterium]